jgi:hypothetical protein
MADLASNISPSAIYRHIENVRPTLLIDEADTFLKDNNEMRGILNGGHTKAGASVLRNVEVNGEHTTKRFSSWSPKALAGINALTDTLEDRSIVVRLQRKEKTANVERLRRRDSDELAQLRRRAARWAKDSFANLEDPDPDVPGSLNDRAADNWRPLLATADLVGGAWPQRARDAACILSGEGHDISSIGTELLASCREAFGEERDAMRSVDLVAQLVVDPEKPWATWDRGKPITPRQLSKLLKRFGISSKTVYIPNLADAKGYERAQFEEAWRSYLPGQNTFPPLPPAIYPSKRLNVDSTGQLAISASVSEASGDGSKNDDSSYSHAGSDAQTDKGAGDGGEGCFDQGQTPCRPPLPPPPDEDRCSWCGKPLGNEEAYPHATMGTVHAPCWDLMRYNPKANGRLGPPAISAGPDDDLADLK